MSDIVPGVTTESDSRFPQSVFSAFHGTPRKRPVHHRRPVAGRLPGRGRPPAGAHAQPRPAGGGRSVVPPPFRPGRALRPEPGGAVHRHVPDEPPVGAERHPARRPPRQRRARRPPARLRTGAVRLHRHEHRPPHRARPAILACRATRACCPGSTRSATCPRAIPTPGSNGCAPRASTSPTTGGRSSTGPRPKRSGARSTTPSTPRPASSPTGCSSASDDRTAVVGRLVRAPLVPAAPSAVPRARAVRHDVRPRVGAAARAGRAPVPTRARSIRCSA